MLNRRPFVSEARKLLVCGIGGAISPVLLLFQHMPRKSNVYDWTAVSYLECKDMPDPPVE